MKSIKLTITVEFTAEVTHYHVVIFSNKTNTIGNNAIAILHDTPVNYN